MEANTSASCRGLAEQLRLMVHRKAGSDIVSTARELQQPQPCAVEN
ncbi:MAG: hypothetical protein U5L03_09845 [Burkholderiaceae bacterium]|nr:hypothetical protein [Burkholderiaceae bacterium]